MKTSPSFLEGGKLVIKNDREQAILFVETLIISGHKICNRVNFKKCLRCVSPYFLRGQFACEDRGLLRAES